jgi:hypothetical protein
MARTTIKRECEHCGIAIYPELRLVNQGGGKFCSTACSNSARAKGPARVERRCKLCGAVFYPLLTQVNIGCGLYCGMSCSGHDNAKKSSHPKEENSPLWKGSDVKKKTEYIRRYKKNNPDKVIARSRSRSFVRRGVIEKKPCETCGCDKSEIHHNDYSEPTDIKFLCKQCHQSQHIGLSAAI